MRPYVRYLRIGWTILCGTVAVLLIVLWVRSYFGNDRYSVQLLGRGFKFNNRFDNVNVNWFAVDGAPPRDRWRWYGERDVPHAFSMTFASLFVLGAIPWLPWLPFRFSLRTLLIAMTLVAVVLGLIVYFAN